MTDHNRSTLEYTSHSGGEMLGSLTHKMQSSFVHSQLNELTSEAYISTVRYISTVYSNLKKKHLFYTGSIIGNHSTSYCQSRFVVLTLRLRLTLCYLFSTDQESPNLWLCYYKATVRNILVDCSRLKKFQNVHDSHVSI